MLIGSELCVKLKALEIGRLTMLERLTKVLPLIWLTQI